jgi:hypothetical protein
MPHPLIHVPSFDQTFPRLPIVKNVHALSALPELTVPTRVP